ncbi:RT0821/Lpp0805 family surface protein [Microvirga terricola]|uniref:Surface antigen domain-containing protein n=1 Tax=Microvirga terricola TaxID=2719797 RepID=A0ABX0VAQ8_9HYPH|nr:RT0821/Lpp0805 family surface protein [Microvirga terricola]NIX76783.1 hypothetical protein [Microvirga terricola]
MAFARRYRSDALLSEAKKILAAGLIALNAGACSLTLGVAGIQDDEPEVTGSVTPQAAPSLSPDLDEEDWRRAKAALALALDPQGPGTIVSWDNPASAMKGSFAAAGAPFVKNDEICRAFSASLGSSSITTLQGTACRPSGGEWALKEVQPAKLSAKG